MAVSFTVLSNVAFTTSVSINKIGADLFIKGIVKVEQGVKFTFRLKTQQIPSVDSLILSVDICWNNVDKRDIHVDSTSICQRWFIDTIQH